MLVLLSPAKKQDFSPLKPGPKGTQPKMKKEISTLVDELRHYSSKALSKLMSLSENLADLNYQRFQDFNLDRYDLHNAKPAIFAFQGDAYQSLNIHDFSQDNLAYLQKSLLILSGLYGYLHPLDLIQPYRLEMKTRLKNEHGNSLYEFWGDKLSRGINATLKKHQHTIVVNLASSEYFKAVNQDILTAPVLTVQFKEKKNGSYKVIGIHAKKARGLMTRFIAKHQLADKQQLQSFDLANYRFSKKLSSDENYVFIR